MHIIKTIKNIIKTRPSLFTTPGHFQGLNTTGEFTRVFGKKLFRADLAEIESMDNLQAPREGILRSLREASGIYGSGASFYLINGSSSGIIALILAVAGRGEKILIGRNAHKSVINALILSGACPVWLETEWQRDWDIPGPVRPGNVVKKLEENPDTKVLWLTSPTYEGIVTDISPIASICREKGVILLVDEAHGALWNFSGQLPASSIHQGADGCVQSLHKTGSCLNQGAMLHLAKDSRVSPADLQQALNIINTTSPSYILLSSIEASVEYLDSNRGRKKLQQLLENIENTKKYLKKHTDAVFLGPLPNYRHDPTKMFFRLKDVPGDVFSDYLQKKCNIEVELNNAKGILALTAIGTRKKHLKYLEKSVIRAYKDLEKTGQKPGATLFTMPQTALTPSEAFFREPENVCAKNAIGRISGETVVKYPPGIPVLIAGEVIQREHLPLLGENLKVVKS